MPNSVGIKLEAALKTYLANNYQGTGEELNGVSIYLGKSPETRGSASYLAIESGEAGGTHAQQGNYEIPVTFVLRTDFDKSAGDTEATLRLRHGERVSAVLGIFGNARTLTVRTALMALDAELGVSTYWKDVDAEDINETCIESRLGFIFEAYLV